MVLCVDVGNTITTIGTLDGTEPRAFWRVVTRERTSDEYAVLLGSLISRESPAPRIEMAGVCSVVPGETGPLSAAVETLLDMEVKIIDGTSDCGIEIATANPAEVGGDRVANATAALHEYGAPAIVVDAGTAMTFDYVSPEGLYVGGVIAPGILAGAQDLWEKARMLPAVDIRKPGRVIGDTTITCMQSGIFFGALGQVESIVRRMWAEIGFECPVMLTGGQAEILKNDISFEVVYDPYLTLKGISYAIDARLRSRP
jgi:type III pantothenate kinase